MAGRASTRNIGTLAVGAVVLTVFVAVALAAFAWPAARLEPRALPIGVAGPAPAAAALERGLTRRGDAFDVRRYADEADARSAIEDREIYGALVDSGNQMTVLTASAASPVVAQTLEDTLAPRDRAHVVDVVSADPDDPRGVAFNSLLLPLTLTSLLVGAICAVAVRPALARAAALVGAAVLAALVAVAVVQGWLGVIPGDWRANVAVLRLLALPNGAPLAGVAALLGRAGLALGGAALVLCGNPWSGVSPAPELLPGWVAFTGQLLPPGAGGSLLRATAFFDGGGFGVPLAVLAAWAAVGLAAVWAATLGNRDTTLEGRSHERQDRTERHGGATAHV